MNFDAPPAANEPKSDPKFEFTPEVTLVPPKGGHYDLLTPERLRMTASDIDNGIMSGLDKESYELDVALGGILAQLRHPERASDPARREAIDRLRKGEHAFLNMPPGDIGGRMQEAARSFEGAEAGIILFPISDGIVQQFSALGYADGRRARLMPSATALEADDYARRLNLLAPPVEVRRIDAKECAVAIEFVEGGERPTALDRAEVEDWLERVQESGLILGFDVDEENPVLDNFIRKDGRLSWVDGNIVDARPAKDAGELQASVDAQRSILEKLVQA